MGSDWKALWADPASGEGFVVGANGRIARGNAAGDGVIPEASGTTADLVSVWGTSKNNVFAVGAKGTILHSSGNGLWVGQPSNVSVPLSGIGGASANSIYTVGAGGTILFNNGQVITNPNVPDGGMSPADAGAEPADATDPPQPCGPPLCMGSPSCNCAQTCMGLTNTMTCDPEGQCQCFTDGQMTRQFFKAGACGMAPAVWAADCGFNPGP
jgi:hypothetical protein